MNERRNPVFSRKVKLRNPFQILSLPLLSKLYLTGYRGHPTYLRKIIFGFTFRQLHKILWRIGWIGTGRFLYRSSRGEKVIKFNARNTQFESLFMPRFVNGYEGETIALLDIIVEDKAVFYDVGSNWGHISLYVASRQCFSGEIHAFEPFPSNFHDLQDIVKQAGLESVIHCHNIALSDSSGSKTMILPSDLRSGGVRVTTGKHGVHIETTTLDELNIKQPDVIKLDVEGHEKNVLMGGKRLFAEFYPMLIMESLAEYGYPGVTLGAIQLLVEMGYLLFQPAFLVQIDGHNVAVCQGYRGKLPEEVELGLFEFIPSERFLLQDYINIFACHSSKLNKLEKLFTLCM